MKQDVSIYLNSTNKSKARTYIIKKPILVSSPRRGSRFSCSLLIVSLLVSVTSLDQIEAQASVLTQCQRAMLSQEIAENAPPVSAVEKKKKSCSRCHGSDHHGKKKHSCSCSKKKKHEEEESNPTPHVSNEGASLMPSFELLNVAVTSRLNPPSVFAGSMFWFEEERRTQKVCPVTPVHRISRPQTCLGFELPLNRLA